MRISRFSSILLYAGVKIERQANLIWAHSALKIDKPEMKADVFVYLCMCVCAYNGEQNVDCAWNFIEIEKQRANSLLLKQEKLKYKRSHFIMSARDRQTDQPLHCRHLNKDTQQRNSHLIPVATLVIINVRPMKLK